MQEIMDTVMKIEHVNYRASLTTRRKGTVANMQ